MRPVRTILAALILSCMLPAQVPIGFGPGTSSVGLLDYFDWYIGTASGCTPGNGGMCVGTMPRGDTPYYTGWFADAQLLPVTTGLPLVGTLNDFSSKNCSGNLMVVQLAEFSWTARNASRIYEVNCMSSYGTSGADTDLPAGWKGHCTNNDDGGQACTWKSRAPFVRGGLLYLPVERQISAGTRSVHDATMIVSGDGGKTWKNPYTVAHSGAASATGDAPKCGSASGSAGNPCTDASYPGSIMWQALPFQLSQWEAVQYGQDGATPPAGINDGCDPAVYTCFMAGEQEATIARVLNTDLPALDVTKYQYYTCPAITDVYRCPGSNPASWTSNFADRTPVALIDPAGNITSARAASAVSFFNVAYIKEFKSYLMSGYHIYGGGVEGTIFWSAPAIQGPWTPVLSSKAVLPGFTAPLLALSSTVSANPPHVKLTTGGDSHGVHTSQGAPIFAQWDLVPGRAPMLQASEGPRYNNIDGAAINAGYIVSDSHATGTIPRTDLVWAFDFYDHGGDTAVVGMKGFHDIANGSAFLTICPNSNACGFFNPGQGATLTATGAQLRNGYQAKLLTVMHETPQTMAIAATQPATGGLTPVNAPAAMQGNGSYSVIGVYRYEGPTEFGRPGGLWSTGAVSNSDNTMIELNQTGGKLELDWGATDKPHYQYLSKFTFPNYTNWYFIAVTVQAQTSCGSSCTPIAKIWVGGAVTPGVLTDVNAGVSYTNTPSFNAATKTPNVGAGPLNLGINAHGDTYSGVGEETIMTTATTMVYGRALEEAEVGLIYNTMKAKMSARGITLQ